MPTELSSATNSWTQPIAEDRLRRSVVELSATGDIVTLAEAQFELGIDPQAALLATPRQQAEDAKVLQTIAEARQWCENEVDRTLRATVQRRVDLPKFPKSDIVEFWAPPLISVDAVSYLDPDGNPQTVAVTDYRVITSSEGKGYVQFGDEFQCPDILPGANDAVQITYTSGYGTEANIPAVAKAAAKLLLTVLYDYDETPAMLKVYYERATSLMQPLRWGSYE